MKRITKYLSLLIIFMLVLTGCTTPGGNNTPTPSIKGEAKIYGVLSEMTYYVGEAFDPIEGITAYDAEGNDVTDCIEIFGNLPIVNGILTEAGTYSYEILVLVNKKQILSREVILTVLEAVNNEPDTTKPVINANSNYSFYQGDKLELNATAVDNVDGDITAYIEYEGISEIPVDENNQLTTIGSYQIILRSQDSSGNKQSKRVTITVLYKPHYEIEERKEMVAEELQGINPSTKLDNYHLVWAEEFNYTGMVDSTVWNYEIGNGDWGWGNGESQYYTNNAKNSYVENGSLRISAIKENINGFKYSSARLTTKNKVDIKYGYIEANIKLPDEGGVWPAFWMMPSKSVYGGWPHSGEVDIMEYVGNNKDKYLGTTHTSTYHGGNCRSSGNRQGTNLTTEFHKYAIEWTPDYIYFYHDDNLYFTCINAHRAENNWKEFPFTEEFFLILNVAVGGTLGGNISSSFSTESMYVDYIRVYQSDYTKKDSEIPSTINVAYTSTSKAINLSWNKATDNIGLKHYEIIVNGKQFAATNKIQYTLNNLSPLTTYYIQVLAVDLAGNYSTSGEIVIKTKE